MASRALITRLRMTSSTCVGSTIALQSASSREVSMRMEPPSVLASMLRIEARISLRLVGAGSRYWRRGEGEKLRDELGAALRRDLHGLEPAAHRVGDRSPLQELQIAEDHGQEVVEVVGDTGG